MLNFNNPGQKTDLKAYYKNFYFQNKLLVYLMAISLVILAVAKSGIFDIFFYVYLIYFGGFILKSYLGEQKVLTTFIISGIIGSLIYILLAGSALAILPILVAIVASASLGLLTAAATYAPNMEIMLVLLGRVKIKWIAIILIALDLLSIFRFNSILDISHIGGIAFGFFSIYIMKNSSIKFQNPFSGLFKKTGPYYKKPKKSNSKRAEDDASYNKRKNTEQAEIDAILDKIKLKGYESLSAKEKQQLFDRSQRD